MVATPKKKINGVDRATLAQQLKGEYEIDLQSVEDLSRKHGITNFTILTLLREAGTTMRERKKHNR